MPRNLERFVVIFAHEHARGVAEVHLVIHPIFHPFDDFEKAVTIFGFDETVDLAAGVGIIEDDLLFSGVVAVAHELEGNQFAEALDSVAVELATGDDVLVQPRMGVFVCANGGNARFSQTAENRDAMLELPGLTARLRHTERHIFVVRKSLSANEFFKIVPSGEFDDDVLVGKDVAGEHPEQIAFDLAIDLIERVLSEDGFFCVARAEQSAIGELCETAHGQRADGAGGVELRARAAHWLFIGGVWIREQVDALSDVFLADDTTVVDCGGSPKNENQKERNNADRLFHISEIGRWRRRLSWG